ncbi:hypothetical protein DFJ73DRAFT_863820 [Zopfochytrium polystomum]|nr:hypothetical protein DFJ73DRAFT_863820 [Zopfochytrium polystomum]
MAGRRRDTFLWLTQPKTNAKGASAVHKATRPSLLVAATFLAVATSPSAVLAFPSNFSLPAPTSSFQIGDRLIIDSEVSTVYAPSLIAVASLGPSEQLLLAVLVVAAGFCAAYLSVQAEGASLLLPSTPSQEYDAVAANDDGSESGLADWNCLTNCIAKMPWALRNPKWLPLLLATLALDIFCFGSLVSFIISVSSSPGFPTYLIFACAIALILPRSYSYLLAHTPKPPPPPTDVPHTGEMILFLVGSALLALVAIVGTAAVAIEGLPAVLQFNDTLQYEPIATLATIRPNTIYSRIDFDLGLTAFSGTVTNCAPPPAGIPVPVGGGAVLNSTTVFACTVAHTGSTIGYTVFYAIITFVTWFCAVGASMTIRDSDQITGLVSAFILGLLICFAIGETSFPLKMAWCPSTDYRDCRGLNLGSFHPKQRLEVFWSLPAGGHL